MKVKNVLCNKKEKDYNDYYQYFILAEMLTYYNNKDSWVINDK